tara:strand:+ start:1086 stop:1484 length:399 start_codon:yes stop_codon:yes gene_type:complete
MSLNDPISDMIARIKNGLMRAKTKIEMPSSNYKIKILEVLKSEGFIINFSLTDSANNKQNLLIDLKYHSGSPVINNIERISKPGRRVYASATSLPKINNGLGIAILSTSKGVMSDLDARKNKLGGEIICKVF